MQILCSKRLVPALVSCSADVRRDVRAGIPQRSAAVTHEKPDGVSRYIPYMFLVEVVPVFHLATPIALVPQPAVPTKIGSCSKALCRQASFVALGALLATSDAALDTRSPISGSLCKLLGWLRFVTNGTRYALWSATVAHVFQLCRECTNATHCICALEEIEAAC